MRWLAWLTGDRMPEGFAASLDEGEHVLAHATAEAGVLVVTSRGLWIPNDGAHRRIAWQHVAKATWSEGVLTVTEAAETEHRGGAVVLQDRRPVKFRLDRPGKLPKVLRQRVDASIVSRYYKELPGGGAWFVQRRAPVGGTVLQVRPDAGTDTEVAATIGAEAAGKLTGGHD